MSVAVLKYVDDLMQSLGIPYGGMSQGDPHHLRKNPLRLLQCKGKSVLFPVSHGIPRGSD